jgi:anaerobic ribonucleoside-triphosphate reductase activating protein
MKYADIFFDDDKNGPGYRTSLFVSGCDLHCKGCFNVEAQDYNFGKEFTKLQVREILDSLKKPHTRGLSILGGDPISNVKKDDSLLNLVKLIKEWHPQKTIFCWTGYTFEEIITDDKCKEFLKYVDMLRDGRFIEEQKDLSKYLGGSTNQRYIDVKRSIEENKVVEYQF